MARKKSKDALNLLSLSRVSLHGKLSFRCTAANKAGSTMTRETGVSCMHTCCTVRRLTSKGIVFQEVQVCRPARCEDQGHQIPPLPQRIHRRFPLPPLHHFPLSGLPLRPSSQPFPSRAPSSPLPTCLHSRKAFTPRKNVFFFPEVIIITLY